jgi:hypothetical protein
MGFIGGEMTNRNNWEFEYTASKIAGAAREQLEYRMGRVKFWEGKKAEVTAEITSKGLEVYEPEAEKFSGYTNSGAGHAQIKMDPTLQARLTEAATKIRENRGKVAEYEAWIQVLEGNPEARLLLKHDDWMYFFGRR